MVEGDRPYRCLVVCCFGCFEKKIFLKKFGAQKQNAQKKNLSFGRGIKLQLTTTLESEKN
tara:strand:+ start:206 stop:385 length:180 start_codon:yes stop_codon:yes gene_type:complete